MIRACMSRSPAEALSLSTQVVVWGRSFTKFLCAWFTRLVRSARNSTFFTQPLRMSTSTSDMDTRVFPVPVAITSRALRCMPFRCSHTALMAIF